MNKRSISYLNYLICLLLTVALCLLSGSYKTPLYAEALSDSPPENVLGSAKTLDGTTILVSIFINNSSFSWSLPERLQIKHDLDIANDFLVSEGQRYGKEVKLIYDFYEHTDLIYHFDSDITTSKHEFIYPSVYNYIDKTIPTEDLLSAYDADSIGYLCFLNGDYTAFTYSNYYYMDYDYNTSYHELCCLYPQRSQKTWNANTLSHEILHLFGARDLYTTREDHGIPKEFVQYIADNYPNDIMFCKYRFFKHEIHNEISDVTAYFLGWIDALPETEQFPSITARIPSVFSTPLDTSGDYSEYTYGDDKEDNDYHWQGELRKIRRIIHTR